MTRPRWTAEGEAREGDRAAASEMVAAGFPRADARDEVIRRERARQAAQEAYDTAMQTFRVVAGRAAAAAAVYRYAKGEGVPTAERVYLAARREQDEAGRLSDVAEAALVAAFEGGTV